jgi:hypothetical protein
MRERLDSVEKKGKTKSGEGQICPCSAVEEEEEEVIDREGFLFVHFPVHENG